MALTTTDSESSKNANPVVRGLRKVYNPLGFKKGYNAFLFVLCGGYLMGFVLSRIAYLSIDGIFCGASTAKSAVLHAAPGECFYYAEGHERIGIFIHLICILPAGLLAVFQFIPAIRYHFMIFHRLNGYAAILLAILGNVGALMIARNAFGGTLATQTLVGALVILTTLGLFNAYYNIKRLQIDQHRKWMIRTWFYFASIITLRLIMLSAACIISYYNYYLAAPCDKIDFTFIGIPHRDRAVLFFYPECISYYNGTNPHQYALVHAEYQHPKNPAEAMAALNLNFGSAGWLALLLHAVAVEIYLHLTPRESERLRQVSYERQVEAGMKNPGNAGLTAQNLGDSDPWMPKSKEEVERNPTREHSADTLTETSPMATHNVNE